MCVSTRCREEVLKKSVPHCMVERQYGVCGCKRLPFPERNLEAGFAMNITYVEKNRRLPRASCLKPEPCLSHQASRMRAEFHPLLEQQALGRTNILQLFLNFGLRMNLSALTEPNPP